MSNFPSDVNVEDYSVPLAVVFPDQGEDVVVVAEEENRPSVEEIVPRYPGAKPDFHKSSEVVTERFRSTMTVERIAEFKAKFGLPDYVEVVPAGDDEVRVHHPG